jgi:TldD protein
VIDTGIPTGLAGHIPFDDEGIPPAETRLITGGLLSGRLHSRETAEKMDEAPTGNARALGVMLQPIVRMTNTYIENGAHDRDAILDSAGNGIYAAGVIGGQTNLEMFTFTSGCGYEIKNGKMGKMYRDIVLSGNVFTTLGAIEMIGNDRVMYGGLGGCGKGGQGPLPVSFGGPHLLIRDVLIGGSR